MVSPRAIVLLPLLLFLAAPAMSQAPACGAVDTDLPPAFSGWAAPGNAPLAVGSGPARVALSERAVFAVAPEREAKPGGFGAVAPFTIARAGRYEIALSTAAWIDVLADGKAVPSGGHRHGPPCTTIRKIVTFQLSPGSHVAQISGSPADAVTVAIASAQ